MKPAALACVLWLSACAGTETGNPSFQGSLGYTAYTSDASVAALRTGGEAATVEQAWLVLGAVRFVRAAECDPGASDEVAAPALGIGDHATGHPVHTALELAAGRYCGVRLPLVVAGADVGKAPADLAQHSIALVGKLGDGAAFELRSALDEELFLQAPDGSFAMDATDDSVVIGFDVAAWLAGVQWSRAQAGPDGRVLVDAAHNADLLAQFEHELARGVVLFRDPDARGVVDPKATPLAGGAP